MEEINLERFIDNNATLYSDIEMYLRRLDFIMQQPYDNSETKLGKGYAEVRKVLREAVNTIEKLTGIAVLEQKNGTKREDENTIQGIFVYNEDGTKTLKQYDEHPHNYNYNFDV